VINLSAAGQQPTHLGAHWPSVPRQPLQCRCIEYLAAVFGDADQMNDKSGNAVSFASIVWLCAVLYGRHGKSSEFVPHQRRGGGYLY
jgi:hypothetical protein